MAGFQSRRKISPSKTCPPHDRAARRRGRHLGHAGGELRSDVSGNDQQGRGRGQPVSLHWSHLPDWNNQTLTPNPDVIYLMPFFNTKDVGPMVMEDSARGGWLHHRQHRGCAGRAALEDVGLQGSIRAKAEIPDPAAWLHGEDSRRLHRRFQSTTYRGYAPAALERGAAATPMSPRRSLRQAGESLSLSQAGSAADQIRRCHRRGLRLHHSPTTRFFQSLDRFVQIEPWLQRDKVMIDMLKSIGIEKEAVRSRRGRRQAS